MTRPFLYIYLDKISPENMPTLLVPTSAKGKKILSYSKAHDFFTTYFTDGNFQNRTFYDTEEEFFSAIEQYKLMRIL